MSVLQALAIGLLMAFLALAYGGFLVWSVAETLETLGAEHQRRLECQFGCQK